MYMDIALTGTDSKLNVVEFPFTKKKKANKQTKILYKEVYMYLKLSWKLHRTWKKKRSNLPRQENLLVLDDTV